MKFRAIEHVFEIDITMYGVAYRTASSSDRTAGQVDCVSLIVSLVACAVGRASSCARFQMAHLTTPKRFFVSLAFAA